MCSPAQEYGHHHLPRIFFFLNAVTAQSRKESGSAQLSLCNPMVCVGGVRLLQSSQNDDEESSDPCAALYCSLSTSCHGRVEEGGLVGVRRMTIDLQMGAITAPTPTPNPRSAQVPAQLLPRLLETAYTKCMSQCKGSCNAAWHSMPFRFPDGGHRRLARTAMRTRMGMRISNNFLSVGPHCSFPIPSPPLSTILFSGLDPRAGPFFADLSLPSIFPTPPGEVDPAFSTGFVLPSFLDLDRYCDSRAGSRLTNLRYFCQHNNFSP